MIYIKPTELRIGNWLLFTPNTKDSRPVQVREITDECLVMDDKGVRLPIYDSNSIDSIKLSAYKLRNCGFDTAHDIYGGWLSPEIEGTGIQLRIRQQESLFFYVTHENDQLPVYFDSLHKLQNWFYAMTGAELNYQPC